MYISIMFKNKNFTFLFNCILLHEIKIRKNHCIRKSTILLLVLKKLPRGKYCFNKLAKNAL